MIYGGVPVESLKVKHYEMDTNSATVQPSDLQAGVTCFARGQKMTGTGKSFEFAMYGDFEANDDWIVPNSINVIHISCSSYPTQTMVDIVDTLHLDFSQEQTIGKLIADNVEYPINVSVIDNVLSITCDKNATFQVFYGKDNYV